jgi:hypothetical protein
MRYRLSLLCVLGGLLLLPGAADAKTATLQGQIVGPAYAAGTRTAVPVLLKSASARRAELRTPLALLLVPSSSTVRAAGRAVRPMALRAGDVFQAKTAVPAVARRAVYPSLTLRKGALSVSKRGSAPSATELQDQINALSAALSQFANSVVASSATCGASSPRCASSSPAWARRSTRCGPRHPSCRLACRARSTR